MTGGEVGPWGWLLLVLLAVAALVVVLRAWLASRAMAGHAPVHGASPETLPRAQALLPMSAADAGQPAPRQTEPNAPAHEPGVPAVGTPWRDPLTGLATRLMLEDQLAAAALRAETRQRRIALLYIDLDGFKAINDSFGYGAGDALLQEVAQRLLTFGRSTDAVARMGADEFIVLLEGDPDHASASLVAERMRQAMQRPCMIEGREVRLSCSVGIVLYPDHGPRARLIARADAAMLAAKRAGGNMQCFFDQGMDHDAQDVIDLQRDLRRAIDTCTGLELHYQPKVHGRSGSVTGVEALLRWHHGQRGMVSPVVFVPVAERFGLIGALGQWVIDEACRQLRLWQDEGLALHVAVNLSVHQLRQNDLVERVQEALARHGVPADRLVFEVTESAAMEDAQASLRLFADLRRLGVSISIDDFGTGYSSLSHLRKLPASQLKIDRSFVQDLARESDAKAIVRAVVRLAHALGLSVVAEGVETLSQKDILSRMGCDELQGYLFAKPMPARHLRSWLQGRHLMAAPMRQQDGGVLPGEGAPADDAPH